MIKLIKFSGDWLISEIEEIPEVVFGDPDCILKYPYQVDGNCLGPWPIYTSQREIIVRSSDITLITEPKQFHLAQYISLVDQEQSEIQKHVINEEFEEE